jgi:hypothetical protein
VLKNYLHSSEIGVWCALFRKRNVRLLLFEEKIIAEIYQFFFSECIAVLERTNGIAVFSNRPHRQNTSFVMALLGVDFG